MTKLVEKVTKINLKFISKPHALLQTREECVQSFKKTGLKLYEKLHSQGTHSQNKKVKHDPQQNTCIFIQLQAWPCSFLEKK